MGADEPAGRLTPTDGARGRDLSHVPTRAKQCDETYNRSDSESGPTPIQTWGRCDALRGDATTCETAGDDTRTRNIQLGRLDAQIVNRNTSNTCASDPSRTPQSPSLREQNSGDLDDLIARWGELSEEQRAAIRALIGSEGADPGALTGDNGNDCDKP